MRCMKRILALFLICSLFLPAAALAEDVCVVKDASAATHVTTGCSYLRVLCPLPGETNVTLSVYDEWGSLIYQRWYGLCSGSFRSRDVHLPLEGDGCDYTVTLTMDSCEYSFTVTREMPMITDTGVYAGGMTLQEMSGGSSRKYAVVLDMDALNEESAAAPMVAGGKRIGEVYFSVLDGKLTVSASLFVQGTIDKANVYIAADAITAQSFGTKHFTGMKTRLDREIPVGATPYVAVMVQLTVTYDPATAEDFSLDAAERDAYEKLLEDWQLMQMTTANEAVG